jgi:hypothetical protein
MGMHNRPEFPNFQNAGTIDQMKCTNLGGEREYLALDDLRMKSKFSRSNTTNPRVGRVEEERKPEKEG